jgi:hypothetical protein
MIISILPFMFRWFAFIITGQPITMTRLLASGELLLLACAISADIFSEIFGVKTNLVADIRWLLIAGLAFVMTMISAALFGIAALRDLKIPNLPVSDSIIVNVSLVIFSLTLFAGAYVKIKAPTQ